MSEKIPYTQVARRITSDIDCIMEEAYLQGKEQGFCDGSIDVKKRVEEAYHKGFEAGQHEATTIEYQQGLEEGKKQAKAQAHLDVCHDIERVAHGNYQKGLDDAWECAKKISLMSPDEIEKVFPGAAKYNRYNLGYSGVEAIERLKAYEQQKADLIKVGDEVDYKGMTKYVVTGIVDDDTICGFSLNGLWNANTIKEVTKTGRHFPQVAELFKAMKESGVTE